MKTLDPGLTSHLAGGATTLCWCWHLTRRDGVVLGFTDHDRDIAFGGTIYEAATGFSASEMTDAVGLGVDNLEVESALSSGRLGETDLASGLYDDARVEIYRVNWADPARRVLMRAGSIGEVKRTGKAFSAEVRGLSHYLQQPSGRLYQYGCDAELGDARCGVDISATAFRGAGSVVAVESARRFAVSGLEAYPAGMFAHGVMEFATGGNAGRSLEIKRHEIVSGTVVLETWLEAAEPVAPSNAFVATAGCDKQFSTCLARFANGANFRGFPHMPGNEVLSSIVRSTSA